MPIAITRCRAELGVTAPDVTIEVFLSGGLPRFSIVGLAEAWTSITEDRAFRSGRSHAEAMGTIAGAGGSWFATDLVEALRAFEAARG